MIAHRLKPATRRARIGVRCAAALAAVTLVAGCTPDPPGTGQSTATAEAPTRIGFDGHLGTLYTGVPLLLNPAETSDDAAVEQYKRLEFDARQTTPDGVRVRLASDQKLTLLCDAGHTCSADTPQLKNSQAIVITAGKKYDGEPFKLTGTAVDPNNYTMPFAMSFSPATEELTLQPSPPPTTASPSGESTTSASGEPTAASTGAPSPTPSSRTTGSGEKVKPPKIRATDSIEDSSLLVDFTPSTLIAKGDSQFMVGRFTVSLPLDEIPEQDPLLTTDHSGDYTANVVLPMQPSPSNEPTDEADAEATDPATDPATEQATDGATDPATENATDGATDSAIDEAEPVDIRGNIFVLFDPDGWKKPVTFTVPNQDLFVTVAYEDLVAQFMR